eukprot:3933075-Rhodomonas_salina.2
MHVDDGAILGLCKLQHLFDGTLPARQHALRLLPPPTRTSQRQNSNATQHATAQHGSNTTWRTPARREASARHSLAAWLLEAPKTCQPRHVSAEHARDRAAVKEGGCVSQRGSNVLSGDKARLRARVRVKKSVEGWLEGGTTVKEDDGTCGWK